MTYQAESLDNIARFFDALAGRAAVWADRTTGVEKKLMHRESIIWGQAAAMLRKTTLKPADK